MALKITTLVENSPGEQKELISEHGLSFFIEKDGQTILFDTGQSDAFLRNAKQLKIDLTAVEHVVLSHGHYDHSGGLRSLTELTTNFKLTLGQSFFQEKYSKSNDSAKFLGNNFDEQWLCDKGINYTFATTDVTKILSDVYVITNFARIHQDEVINQRFVLKQDGTFVPDPFNDEILLAIDTSHGLVLLLGCSHPGMKNMITFTTETLERPLYAILGGSHLVESSTKSVELSIDFLQKESLKIIGLSHCTGKQAMDKLAISNNNFFHIKTGSCLSI